MIIKSTPLGRVFASALLVTALSACSSNDDDNTDLDLDTQTETPEDIPLVTATCDVANATETPSAADAPYFAFASTRASDFGSGFYERIAIGESIELSGCSESNASSDSVVDTDGRSVFGIGRFNQDNVTRYEPESFDVVYQYSVVGDDGVAANPHDMAFVSDTKAYVARYGTTGLWIVNPSATSQEEFFVDEIDLSAYDADGATEMTQLVVVGDQLFVLMQRLQLFSPTLPSYIAVIDINTDTEIATGMGADGLNGIELPMRNSVQMFHNEETNDLVVASTGDAFGAEGDISERMTGGVLLVDSIDYSTEVLIDDDTLGEFVDEVIIASADKGYVASFASFGTSFLRAFNPTTGVVEADPLADFNGPGITTLEVGPQGNVWVGIDDSEAPGFDRINPADDSLVGARIRTELIPETLVFILR